MSDADGRQVCPTCGGCGYTYDDAARGKRWRAERTARGLAANQVARAMDISAMYLCDLELGRRHWSLSLSDRYLKALADLSGTPTEPTPGPA